VCWHSKLRNAGKAEERPSEVTPLSCFLSSGFPKGSGSLCTEEVRACCGVCEIDLGSADIGALQLERVMNCAGY